MTEPQIAPRSIHAQPTGAPDGALDRLEYRLIVALVFGPCLLVTILKRLSAAFSSLGGGTPRTSRTPACGHHQISIFHEARSDAHAAVGHAFQA